MKWMFSFLLFVLTGCALAPATMQAPLVQVSGAAPFEAVALDYWDQLLAFLLEQAKLVVAVAIAALLAWVKSRWSAFRLEGPMLHRAIQVELEAKRAVAAGLKKPTSKQKRKRAMQLAAGDLPTIHRINLPGTGRKVLEKYAMPEVQRRSQPPVVGLAGDNTPTAPSGRSKVTS